MLSRKQRVSCQRTCWKSLPSGRFPDSRREETSVAICLFSRQTPHLHGPIGFCSPNLDHPSGTGWDGFRKPQSGCHYWSPGFHVISVPTLCKAWFSWSCQVSFWFLVSEFLHLTNQLLWFVSKLGLYSWVRRSFLLTSQETEYETSDHHKIRSPCFIPYFWEDHSSSQ